MKRQGEATDYQKQIEVFYFAFKYCMEAHDKKEEHFFRTFVRTLGNHNELLRKLVIEGEVNWALILLKETQGLMSKNPICEKVKRLDLLARNLVEINLTDSFLQDFGLSDNQLNKVALFNLLKYLRECARFQSLFEVLKFHDLKHNFNA
mmetsp:Transcript_11670/g.19710  ORF Transcript_11670/g.19710 Transcript_11670/m.19710 type:complete len:149 (+) Transcript_11670:548-994(+)|eukprot:CAMPEP_0168608866 /NCGR_PEP_ID=MMETSP0449_2-20121227/883_1 /TAXON_ID=1082188 /ORGANISM="Strombidium rassoulzadegani, Strain ras09" /LENGTH=148 /DNA_ID=CAMNT_0008648935 /DNA_START=1962 /DNA_END=2408 /DNA_ORIENTATION=+